MAKNNKLINSLNEIARRNRSQNVATAADQMVPQIYAAIAIALHRTYGFGYKRINDVFVESQHIWESYAGDGAGMVKKCEEETGVTVCSPEEAQRLMEMQNGSNGNCGSCAWHDNFNGTTDWICSNEDSDSYGAVTSYDDYCIDYEPKQ